MDGVDGPDAVVTAGDEVGAHAAVAGEGGQGSGDVAALFLSVFSGLRFPREVIVVAVRCTCATACPAAMSGSTRSAPPSRPKRSSPCACTGDTSHPTARISAQIRSGRTTKLQSLEGG
jgi:hypothetical protein